MHIYNEGCKQAALLKAHIQQTDANKKRNDQLTTNDLQFVAALALIVHLHSIYNILLLRTSRSATQFMGMQGVVDYQPVEKSTANNCTAMWTCQQLLLEVLVTNELAWSMVCTYA